jgi:hypothetical protein
MNYWSVRDLRFFHHSITPMTRGQLPVPSLAIMLGRAFKTRLFHPCKKLDLLKPSIPL